MTRPPSAKAVRNARAWLKQLRVEAQAKAQYQDADEPRARERARKRWLHELAKLAAIKRPSDEALRAAKEK